MAYIFAGRQGPVQGNKEALATVTGIVDGTGSVGAALGQVSKKTTSARPGPSCSKRR